MEVANVRSGGLTCAVAGFSRTGIHGLAAVGLALFSAVTAQSGMPGSVIALVPAITFVVLATCGRQRAWDRIQVAAAIFAIGGCLAVFLSPGLLNLAVTWASLGAFGLSRRGYDVGDLMRTANILVLRGAFSFFVVASDLVLLSKVLRRRADQRTSLQWRYAVLPILTAATFVLLMKSANPVLNAFLNQLAVGDAFDILLTWAPLAFVLSFVGVWSLFRMKSAAPAQPPEIDRPAPAWHTGYFAPAPVIATLAILNALFLAQNLLDARYIWSAADLPPGMTYSAYVHDGASTLIITVLLAAMLMILALWPGSRTEQSAAVRGLVYLWIIQNLVLVVFCVARTLSYIDAYGMTLMRLTGLVWMGLIVAGLVLIAARVIGKRSNLWLLNSNLAAAFMLLWVSGFVDYRAIAADYNVTRAIDHVGIYPNSSALNLDLDYLDELGPSAIPSLDRLLDFLNSSSRLWTIVFKSGDATLLVKGRRSRLYWQAEEEQRDWKTWTLRHWQLAIPPDLKT